MPNPQVSKVPERAASEPRLKVDHVSIARLRPWPENPRIMSEAEMAKLVRSIQSFGLVEPLVVRRADRMVIGGHQRLEAAKALGMKTVPVVLVDVTESEAKALNLALNRISGEWDLPKLGALLDELRDVPNLDATLTGFDPEETDQLLAEWERSQRPEEEESFDAEAAILAAQEATGPTRVQPGELWQLGPHRLLCADCTVAENWNRLLAGSTAQAIVTDPPYGINYVGGRAAQVERIAKARRGVDAPSDAYWDDLSPEEYRRLLKSSLSLAHQYSDEKAPLYLWFASTHLHDVFHCMNETGWQERNLLVWVKNNGAGALFAQYKHWYEPLFYAHKQGQAPRWHGPTNERTVWEHDKPAANDLHPTMKPVALIERAISNATAPGHLVLDPFLGSGTAIIAAEHTGRRCYGMDLDARYASVILARWEALTGQEAIQVSRSTRPARRPARKPSIQTAGKRSGGGNGRREQPAPAPGSGDGGGAPRPRAQEA